MSCERYTSGPRAIVPRQRRYEPEPAHIARSECTSADDEPAHGPELAQASEDGTVAGATWHAAAGGDDVAHVPLVLAGDRARARFSTAAPRAASVPLVSG